MNKTIKKAETRSSLPLKISNAQTSHDDLFPTIIKALGGDYKQFGTPIDEIEENSTRKRYHYNTLFNDEGKESVLKEYVIEGDARDMNNYKLTGNEWEIKHSIYN